MFGQEAMEHKSLTTDPYEGTVFERLSIPKEANFPVYTVPAQEIVREDEFTVGKNCFAIIREPQSFEDGVPHVFKFASNRYKPLLNQDIMYVIRQAIIELEVDAREMRVQHFFSNDYSRWQCNITFPKITIEPKVGDIIKYGLQINNSYDLTWMYEQFLRAFRLWCLNGCTTSESAGNGTHRKHTTNISVEGEGQKIANGLEAFFESEGEYQRWMNIHLTHTMVVELFKMTLAKYTVGGQVKTNKKVLDSLMVDWTRQAGNTMWQAYNVATAWASHSQAQRGGWTPNTRRNRHEKVSTMLNSNIWKEFEHVSV